MGTEAIGDLEQSGGSLTQVRAWVVVTNMLQFSALSHFQSKGAVFHETHLKLTLCDYRSNLSKIIRRNARYRS